MKALKFLVASAVLAFAAPSFAGPAIPTLTFETIGNFSNLSVAANNPYSGITFSDNAYGIRSRRDGGGSGSFYRDPVNLGALMMFNDGIPSASDAITLTVAGGFEEFFSIEYTGKENARGSVEIYDVNGALLASKFFIPPSGVCPGSVTYVCIWDVTEFKFSGVAHSIKLFGASTDFFFDNIQLGLRDPGQVPEPGSMSLGFAALAALALSRRRKTH